MLGLLDCSKKWKRQLWYQALLEEAFCSQVIVLVSKLQNISSYAEASSWGPGGIEGKSLPHHHTPALTPFLCGDGLEAGVVELLVGEHVWNNTYQGGVYISSPETSTSHPKSELSVICKRKESDCTKNKSQNNSDYFEHILRLAQVSLAPSHDFLFSGKWGLSVFGAFWFYT